MTTRLAKAFWAGVLLLSVSTGPAAEPAGPGPSLDSVVVVLGNEPLDDRTPTVDMAARVRAAVAYWRTALLRGDRGVE
jgi:hypothetical protein